MSSEFDNVFDAINQWKLVQDGSTGGNPVKATIDSVFVVVVVVKK